MLLRGDLSRSSRSFELVSEGARRVLPKDEGISTRHNIPKCGYKGVLKGHQNALEDWYTGELEGVMSEIYKVHGQMQQES